MSEQDLLVEGEEGQDHQGGGASPDSGRNEPGPVPYHRFQQVNAKFRDVSQRMAEYEKFGDPKTVAEKLARLEEVMKDQNFTPSEKERLRKEIREADPEYAEMLQEWKSDRESRRIATATAGERKADDWLKELGITKSDSNPEYASQHFAIQELVGGIIALDVDPKTGRPTPGGLLHRLLMGDATAYDDAWKSARKLLPLGTPRRQADAAVQRLKTAGLKPPVTPNKGEPKAPERELTEREKLSRASDRAAAMLEVGEEE